MVINCSICGGDNEVNEEMIICDCKYCGMTFTIPPRVNNAKIRNLFNNAVMYRISNYFDRAMADYEKILDEDSNNAEAHWGIVLCRYGVEYVDDERTQSKIPTCHRTQLSPIYMDPNYRAAIENADIIAKSEYEKNAEVIGNIQKRILETTKKIKPYDIFICYKESDEYGRRTEDSSIAQDIYTYLVNNKYNVFFSRVTLKAFGGVEFEPYIYAALRSAKVMIVVGTEREYLEAPWVKNEWGRFLAMQREDETKVLIPCYMNIEVKELPAEFGNLEAFRIDTPTFMLDLLKSIENIIKPNMSNKIEIDPKYNGEAMSLIVKGFTFLEISDFNTAINSFNRSIDLYPKNSKAYWGLMLSKCKCVNNQELIARGKPLSELEGNDYELAMKFATTEELEEYNEVIVAIENNIDDIRNKLKQNQFATIKNQKVCEEIKKYKFDIDESEKNLQYLFDELYQVEAEIKQSIGEYQVAVMEYSKKLDDIYAEVRGINGGLSKVGELSEKDANVFSMRIKQSQINLETEKVTFTEAKVNDKRLLNIHELLNRREDILAGIDEEKIRMDINISLLEQLNRKMKDVTKKYEELYIQIARGEFEMTKVLIEA